MISRLSHSFQRIASPPPATPCGGIVFRLVKPNFSNFLATTWWGFLVSERKITSGSYSLQISRILWTVQGFPSPWQFHASTFKEEERADFENPALYLCEKSPQLSLRFFGLCLRSLLCSGLSSLNPFWSLSPHYEGFF